VELAVSTGQRFVLPLQTVIGATGVPLPGAQLFFYQSGTSTLATTYQDEGLSTPNQNPVVAGSNGLFGNIFLNPSSTYKVILQDENNVQQWECDPVVAPGANTSSYLTYATIAALRTATGSAPPLVYVEAYSASVQAPIGGGWFAYDPGDTATADNGGTVIVDTSGNRYHRLGVGPVSIDCFGAVQDSGITDNASAINAALGSCVEVLIPGSTSGAWYGFSEALTIHGGVHLTGTGPTSILKASAAFGTGAPLLQNASTAPTTNAARDDGIVIENLTLDANSQGDTSISLVAVTGAKVRNVRLLNGPNWGLAMGAVSTATAIYPQNVWVEDLYVSNFAAGGILVTAGAEITFLSPVIESCATTTGCAVQLLASQAGSTGRNIKLLNPILRSCGGAGIEISGNGSATWSEMSVLGGSIDAQTGNGFVYQDVAGLQVSGLIINGPSLGGVVASVPIVGSTGVQFNDVAVRSTGLGDGFYIIDGVDVVIEGCLAYGCNGNGVRLDGNTQNTTISGGAFANNGGGWGIVEANGSVDYTHVVGAALNGNSSGAFSLAGQHSSPRISAASGYQEVCGVIEQWGHYDSGGNSWAGGPTAINFPTPFPNSCNYMSATCDNQGGVASGYYGAEIVTPPSLTGMTVKCAGYNSGGSSNIRGFYWRAKGN
jgi:hypothetical protein